MRLLTGHVPVRERGLIIFSFEKTDAVFNDFFSFDLPIICYANLYTFYACSLNGTDVVLLFCFDKTVRFASLCFALNEVINFRVSILKVVFVCICHRNDFPFRTSLSCHLEGRL